MIPKRRDGLCIQNRDLADPHGPPHGTRSGQRKRAQRAGGQNAKHTTDDLICRCAEDPPDDRRADSREQKAPKPELRTG